MKFPDSVIKAVQAAAETHGDDIPTAVQTAEDAVRALPEFDTLTSSLIHKAVQELVYEYRRMVNQGMRRGEWGQQESQPSARDASGAVEEVYRSCFDYFIGRKTLGVILGKELEGIAAKERATSDGHLFNAALCEELRGMVKDEQTVKDAVSETKLRRLFKKLKKKREPELVA